MNQFKVVKCQNCGGPTYSDAKRNGFYCAYCGSLLEWTAQAPPEITFSPKHKGPEMVDDCFDLWRLGDKMTPAPKGRGGVWSAGMTTDAVEKLLDRKSWERWRGRELYSVLCTNCGATANGFSTQNLFSCEYCGNKIAQADALASDRYQKDLIIGDDNTDLPALALPFTISRDEAQAAVADLVRERPKAFEGLELSRRLGSMQAIYIPHIVADASVLMCVNTKQGRVLLYRDIVNWSSSLTGYFLDYRLLTDLSPWDFSEIAPFKPAFMEGDIKIMSATASIAWKAKLADDQFADVAPALRAAYGSSDIEPLWLRFHIRSTVKVMLPIYYLDKEEKGPKVRFTVNGQSGQVSCLGRGQSHSKRTLVKEPPPNRILQSDEITLCSPYIPVVESRKQKDLYKPVPYDKAIIKPSGIMSIFKLRH